MYVSPLAIRLAFDTGSRTQLLEVSLGRNVAGLQYMVEEGAVERQPLFGGTRDEFEFSAGMRDVIGVVVVQNGGALLLYECFVCGVLVKVFGCGMNNDISTE